MSMERRLSLLEEALRDEADKPRLRVFAFAEPDTERDAALEGQYPRDRLFIVYTGVLAS
jgi:hypothetical protein